MPQKHYTLACMDDSIAIFPYTMGTPTEQYTSATYVGMSQISHRDNTKEITQYLGSEQIFSPENLFHSNFKVLKNTGQ